PENHRLVKLLNGAGKIEKRFRGLHDEVADEWHDPENIPFINSEEQAVLRPGKLEAEEFTTRFQDPANLLERKDRVGNVPHAEGHGDRIKAVVGKGDFLRICKKKSDVRTVVFHFLPGKFQHVLAKISSHN